MRLRSTSHERPKSDSNNTSHAKDRHGNTALPIALPNIRQSARDDIDADRTSTTSKEPGDDQSGKVGRRGRRDQPDEEQDVAGEVAGHAADILGQRHEEEREDCCSDVPGGCRPVQPGEVGLADAELGFHLYVAGSVGSGGEAC